MDDPSEFTFIDLIKGFIPLSFNDISKFVHAKKFIDIIFDFRHFLFQESERIWTFRCSAQHEKEINNNISARDKTLRNPSNNYIDTYRKIDVNNRFNLDALEAHILTGTRLLSYYDMAPR